MIAEDISNAVDKKPKTPSQLKKEAAKAEKLAKFRKKEQKLAELKASSASKQNEVKFSRRTFIIVFRQMEVH